MPGGYTSASAAPVTRRSATSTATLPAAASHAFAIAPATQPIQNRRRGFSTSGRLSSAETSVPITNPPCTAIVSQAVSAAVRRNSATIAALAAVAENHNVMPRNIASESHASCICGERVGIGSR